MGELRKTSSLCNMLAVGFYSHESSDLVQNPPKTESPEPVPTDRDQITGALKACLRQFHEEYGSRFMVVSVGRDPGKPKEDYC